MPGFSTPDDAPLGMQWPSRREFRRNLPTVADSLRESHSSPCSFT